MAFATYGRFDGRSVMRLASKSADLCLGPESLTPRVILLNERRAASPSSDGEKELVAESEKY